MVRFILQRLFIIPLALILIIGLTYAYAHTVQWDYASRYSQLYYSLKVIQQRPEALDAGSIILTGLDPDVLLASVEIAVNEKSIGVEREIPPEYQVKNTSTRVVKLIIGTAKLAPRWKNLENFSRYDWDIQ